MPERKKTECESKMYDFSFRFAFCCYCFRISCFIFFGHMHVFASWRITIFIRIWGHSYAKIRFYHIIYSSLQEQNEEEEERKGKHFVEFWKFECLFISVFCHSLACARAFSFFNNISIVRGRSLVWLRQEEESTMRINTNHPMQKAIARKLKNTILIIYFARFFAVSLSSVRIKMKRKKFLFNRF